MAPNPFFSGRIPKDLYERIAKHIEETGESKTQLLINALATYLGFSIQPSNLSSNLLETRITELEQKLIAVDKLAREVAELKQSVASMSTVSDNKFDNNLDNVIIPGQLSILEKNSEIDNTPDNSRLEQELEEAGYKEEDTRGDWKFLGNMHIPEITDLPGLESWDRTKLKQKLRNIKKHKKEQKTVIASYLFELVGKEPGTKGQMIFAAYRSTLSNNQI